MKPSKLHTWDEEIRELDEFFSGKRLPEKVRINNWSLIVDSKLFLESHFAMVRYHNGEEAYLPYLNRIIELKTILENNYLK